MSFWGNLFQQKYIGKQWGIIALSAGQLAIFVGILNLMLNSVSAFDNIDVWLQNIGISINFWIFLGVIIIGLLLVLVLLFKYALPSFWSVFNEQFYQHNSLLRVDIELLKTENEKIREENKAISEMLKELLKRK